jgi:hypothetical protein
MKAVSFLGAATLANLHSSEHELSNGELNNVAGGACEESEKEKAAQYEIHKESDVCPDHTWSCLVYTGIGTAAFLPSGRHCNNCHYSTTSDYGASATFG